MLPVIPPIRLSRKCERCGLRYSRRMDYCYHCHGLSDSEVEQLQERVSKDNAGHRELGMTMLFFTAGGGALLLSILLLAVLFG